MPRKFRQSIVALLIAALLAPQASLFAAEPAAGTPDPQVPASAPAPAAPQFSAAQLEQAAAPVALYPDALLAQVLMAATYPLDVVSAARWIKANAELRGAELDAAAEQQPWDVSVKSLLPFPQVLQMMDEKLDWTRQLGDAFLAQPQDLMNAVQRLRAQAQAQGTLQSNPQQTVTVEESGPSKIIVIQPTQPSVVYVPAYNPAVVYGPWPYPAYPPYVWYPAGYAATGMALSFGMGVVAGYALWGRPNWHTGHVTINHKYYRRHHYGQRYGPPPYSGHRPGPRPDHRYGPPPGASAWRHDAARRGNVPYGNSNVARQYQDHGRGLNTPRERRNARERFRDRSGVNTGGPRPSPAIGDGSGAGERRSYGGRREAGERRNFTRPSDDGSGRIQGRGGQRFGGDRRETGERRNFTRPSDDGSGRIQGRGGQRSGGDRRETGERRNFTQPSDDGSGRFQGRGGQRFGGDRQRGFQRGQRGHGGRR